jgi:hypothetical protein
MITVEDSNVNKITIKKTINKKKRKELFSYWIKNLVEILLCIKSHCFIFEINYLGRDVLELFSVLVRMES